MARTGLPTEVPRIGAAKAFELMQMDKKVLGGTVRLVLLEKLGRAIVTAQYPGAALEATLAEHFRMNGLAPYAALMRNIRADGAIPSPLPSTDRNISAIATASFIPRRFAGWSTRPRCSSITKAICTGPG